MRTAASQRVSSIYLSEDDEARNQRYNTIEAWLVSKVVHQHDDVCGVLTGSEDGVPPGAREEGEEEGRGKAQQEKEEEEREEEERMPPASKRTRLLSTDTIAIDDEEWGSTTSDNKDRECPICFEPFKAGEIVSWSPDPSCGHIFHQ
jgi:hypothetical protein